MNNRHEILPNNVFNTDKEPKIVEILDDEEEDCNSQYNDIMNPDQSATQESTQSVESVDNESVDATVEDVPDDEDDADRGVVPDGIDPEKGVRMKVEGKDYFIDPKLQFKDILSNLPLFDDEDRERKEYEQLRTLIEDKFLREKDPYKDFKAPQVDPKLLVPKDEPIDFVHFMDWVDFAKRFELSDQLLEWKSTTSSYTMTMYHVFVDVLNLVPREKPVLLNIHYVGPLNEATESFIPYFKDLVNLIPNLNLVISMVGPDIPAKHHSRQFTIRNRRGQALQMRYFKMIYQDFVRIPIYTKPDVAFALNCSFVKHLRDWKDYVSFLVKSNIPGVFTEFSIEQCNRFLSEHCSTIHPHVIESPRKNPFASVNESSFGVNKTVGLSWQLNGAIFVIQGEKRIVEFDDGDGDARIPLPNSSSSSSSSLQVADSPVYPRKYSPNAPSRPKPPLPPTMRKRLEKLDLD